MSPEEFKWILDEAFLLNGLLDIADLIPWLGFLDLQGCVKRMKTLSNQLDRLLMILTLMLRSKDMGLRCLIEYIDFGLLKSLRDHVVAVFL
ncbi:hypothetical protein FEM48_Zijuj01G0268700 [Ziziphus jujuba var. spinosa]|uniref:Uncharacterized protein n=1 Tax=Ziziphus jujuba var. spinosa TaxID=714518 RepID=A0A978W541_ZIZJJ|nr:hypothetical protein FEM48_Zijuj01G0268700 [Ziziphus jujuba var. spinosa]